MYGLSWRNVYAPTRALHTNLFRDVHNKQQRDAVALNYLNGINILCVLPLEKLSKGHNNSGNLGGHFENPIVWSTKTYSQSLTSKT